MIIAPTVTAVNTHQYREQVERVQDFATTIHVDFMDGEFVKTRSPGVGQLWWPSDIKAHLHLMCENPRQVVGRAIKLEPDMIVVHAEADMSEVIEALKDLKTAGIKSGLAILQRTDPEDDDVYGMLSLADHALVFSGNLGYHGGEADLKLLDKVEKIKKMFPDIEIGWDGGIDSSNARQLVEGGVDVLNIGGFIQKSDNPADRYKQLQSVIA